VAGHVLEHPLDRVVGVRGLVNVLRRALIRQKWAYVDKLALALVAAAHVLIDEDELLLDEELRHPRAKPAAIVLDAVGRHRIRRAEEEDRILLLLVFRRIDRREKLDPVSHGHERFVLRVVLFDPRHPLAVVFGQFSPALRRGGQRQAEHKNKASAQLHVSTILSCYWPTLNNACAPVKLTFDIQRPRPV